ncbi:MAG TPA: MCE family protein [Mycobacteriales bacterium]|jgi:phospholipid/cholesterol/gamma-HCH transport system substrate-binding protein|nr:MCE family protein [Mycobacteriales bacterium]
MSFPGSWCAKRRSAAIAASIVVAFVAAGCGPGLQDFSVGRGVSGPSYKLTAVFNDATGLPIGGRVELHDVTIGRVSSLTTSGFKAYVHMVIEKSVQLPSGTRASLALTTPLGEEYVDLLPPAVGAGAKYLESGDEIAATATNRAPDVEDLLSAFSAVLNGGGIGQISTIVSQLDVALAGRAKTGRSLIAELNDVLSQLDAHTGEIDHTLTAVAQLSKELAAQHTLLVRGLVELRPGIADLQTDTAGFTRLLTRISLLGRTATQVLDSVQGTLLTDLDDLAPTLDTLVALRGRLGSTLAGLRKFAILLDRAVPGDYLNLVGSVIVPRGAAQ